MQAPLIIGVKNCHTNRELTRVGKRMIKCQKRRELRDSQAQAQATRASLLQKKTLGHLKCIENAYGTLQKSLKEKVTRSLQCVLPILDRNL